MIRIGIVGYGNLGRGAEGAVHRNPDMELAAVFTRREPSAVVPDTPGVPVVRVDDAPSWADRIDVMILCGGSAEDLPVLTPHFARHFNVVDSFDNHAAIAGHFAEVDRAARESGHVALVSAGWDPGLFSVQRLLGAVILPEGESYTFWGKGVSQGHSQAIRCIPGVTDARQYTIPKEEMLCQIRNGEMPRVTPHEMHHRHCVVVAEGGTDRAAIEEEIKAMPNYFAGYNTTVEFVDRETLLHEYGGLPHGGTVIRSGRTGWADECHQIMEFRLQLESNPQFTAAVLVACARAVSRLNARGERGCKTVFDLAPSDLSAMSGVELLRKFL